MPKNLIKHIYNHVFKLKNKLFRGFMLFLKLRPASYPYVTGDGFRKMANHIYDETGKCKAEDIQEGQIVFLGSFFLEEYFENIHKNITCHYTLISHNSDKNIKEEHLKFIDEKIIKWYAQNVLVTHYKLIPIPLGIDNIYFYHNGIPSLFNKFSKIEKQNRKNRIIFGFSIQTNPIERQRAYDLLTHSDISDKLQWTDNPHEYLDLITNYKFIAAPDGNGHDDPRRWQAVYVHVVPIVKKSVAMEYFKNLGLPLWLIDDWGEIAGLTEKNLNDKYEQIINNSSTKALFMDYWKNKILNK